MDLNQESVSLPPNSHETKSPEDKRLWIGNLDPRINEYQLLKLMQKYGNIEKFDLLFHRSGALAGQPRGYAFITYASKEEAANAKNLLHNKIIGNRRITVTWAHSMNNDESEKHKPEIDIPALAGAKGGKNAPSGGHASRQTQIQAIEAKLKLMERKNALDDFEINKTVATETPIISQYQQATDHTGGQGHAQRYKHHVSRRREPYTNKHRRR